MHLAVDNLTLVVYGAKPGSDSEDRLRLLGSWAGTPGTTLDQSVRPRL
ncbi:hypothetical protein Mame01_18030 [Microbispora amethystogenes]|nr:hypothetical protein Mame01_18030 [Microbispora amethystogenes]